MLLNNIVINERTYTIFSNITRPGNKPYKTAFASYNLD